MPRSLAPLRLLAPLAAALALAAACEARRVERAETPRCARCHAFPPDTGAHLAHARPAPGTYAADLHLAEDGGAGATAYDFGCAHCHPAIDPDEHVRTGGGPASDPVQRIVLSPPAPPVAGDLLKARNHPAAAYDPATKTCSGVYCHSTGQETPGFDRDGDLVLDATPPWTRDPALGPLGCDACHGNPPRYPSGGPGAADANSHLGLADFGFETGHFAGLPGPAHEPKHGGGDPATWGAGHAASPITCQACHFETVDPANVRPGGFFYLDTTGDYALRDLGEPTRFELTSWKATQCTTCHDGVVAPLGAGRVLPGPHVNGRREVAFDRRAALPAGYAAGLPALATEEPIRPYYVTLNFFALDPLAPADCATSPVPSCGVAEDVVPRPTAAGGAPVLTMTLEHATYDPATKTCSSVACHLDRQYSVDVDREGTPPIPPLRWGGPYAFDGEPTVCIACHLR